MEKEKMTFQDYQRKYTKIQNTKNTKFIIFLLFFLIAIIIIYCLFEISYKVYTINKYAGYAVMALSAILFILFYIVPIVKLSKYNAFMVNVNGNSKYKAKKYNESLRKKIALNFVSYGDEVEESGWYSENLINDLRKGISNNNKDLIKQTLTTLYKGDVRKNAKTLITNYSTKAGLLTAVSQSSSLDTALLTATEFSMIKEIVFLYGFRPSDARMLKIYTSVINNALISYGASNIITGSAKKFGESLAQGIPVLGKLISTTIESASQGIINSLITVIIGYQTISYLTKEYRLQDILDEIDFNIEEDLKEETQIIKKTIETNK